MLRRYLKILWHFHQECLRCIVNIKWNTKTRNAKVLRGTGCTSIESIIIMAQIQGSGHVSMSNDNKPKQLLYSQLHVGKRRFQKPGKRQKDCLKSKSYKYKKYLAWQLGKAGIKDWESTWMIALPILRGNALSMQNLSVSFGRELSFVKLVRRGLLKMSNTWSDFALSSWIYQSLEVSWETICANRFLSRNSQRDLHNKQ